MGFVFMCVYVYVFLELFIIFFIILAILKFLVAHCFFLFYFLKKERKEDMELQGSDVSRIFEDMGKMKIGSDYIV